MISAQLLLAVGLLCLHTLPATADQDLDRVPSAEVRGGVLFYRDSEMHDLYGIAPVIGGRFGLQLGRGGEVFVGAGYIGDGGEPYVRSVGFDIGEDARFRAIPLEFGVRFAPRHDTLSRWYFGFAFDLVHVSERLPGTGSADDDETPTYSGWGPGLRVLVGPEIRLSNRHLALGFEFSLGGNRMYIRHGDDRRTVDLAAYGWRTYLRYYPQGGGQGDSEGGGK